MKSENRVFIETVWKYFKQHGRHDLPWRKTKNPYRILVSESMLQQTQVERVIPKYKSFIKKFPSVIRLSEASLGDVLKEWQGLGYNRRAKNLHECVQRIVEEHNGRFPRTYEALVALPGIGPYTAGAVMAFAYNQPVPMIETNIRSAYLHHFFADTTDVHDTDVVRFIALHLEEKEVRENPREWYSALMDYGAYIKKEFGNPNKKSKHYTKQSKFNGSDRQIRGALLRELAKSVCTTQKLYNTLNFENTRIQTQLTALKKEGLIEQKNRTWQLKD